MSPRERYQVILQRLLLLAAFCLQPLSRIANKISWRFGRPYRCLRLLPGLITGGLAPGMVLLSHKDYELTNLFIPGYWTHAAVVADGNEVVEAVSSGVIRTRLEDFISRTDDLQVLRPAFCEAAGMRKAAAEAGKYVGYRYNFLFSPSPGSVYCTELVFRAYERTIPTALMMPKRLWESGEFVRL